jgi:predicted dehydrogenase
MTPADVRVALMDPPPEPTPVGVAVVGCGYWGPNLIRNFSTCPASRVVMVCDRDPSRLERGAAQAPRAEQTNDFAQVLAHPEVEAVAVATPAASHGALAAAALRAGKHVLVEKPLATSQKEAEELVRLAEANGRTLSR